jgi:sulfate adenylyltransferase subunit 1 (EFTu-like GTPase family)
VLTIEPPTVGTEFEAEVVWMDERPLDPGRVYLIKQATKTVTAELHHGLVLNQIGTVNVSTARPLVFDRYVENRATGSFVIIDPATHFTAGAGMISNPLTHTVRAVNAPISAAERVALLARHAGSDAEAVEAVRKALEELLS